MVVRLRPSGNTRSCLEYNEEKLRTGDAECIYARNFIKDAGQLTSDEKKQRFFDIAELAQRQDRTAMHVVLQFAPADRLDQEKLIDISREFMRRMGLDRQPYLVYRHLDAFTPHLHLVSTNIQPDGGRLTFGRNLHSVYD